LARKSLPNSEKRAIEKLKATRIAEEKRVWPRPQKSASEQGGRKVVLMGAIKINSTSCLLRPVWGSAPQGKTLLAKDRPKKADAKSATYESARTASPQGYEVTKWFWTSSRKGKKKGGRKREEN